MDLLGATITEAPPACPQLRDLLALWTAKRGERGLPARRDFSWMELRPWFGNLILVDVIGDGEDFLYRLWGSELARFLGYELTGRRSSEVESWLGPNPMREYRQVCRTREPLSVLVRIPDSKDTVRMDKLDLPLSGDGRRVDKVMAAIYPSGR